MSLDSVPAQPEPSHFRDTDSRNLQTILLQPVAKAIVELGIFLNLTPSTQLDKAFLGNEAVSADNITQAGMQLSIRSAREIVQGKVFFGSLDFLVGSALDALDGSVARQLGTASPEGAVKDVVADRIIDLSLMQIISDELKKYGNYISEEKVNDLQSRMNRAVCLSTLTKSMLDMSGVDTISDGDSESGKASQLHRRVELYRVLGSIYLANATDNDYLKSGLIDKIKSILGKLEADTIEVAAKRRKALSDQRNSDWRNSTNYANPNSSASVEALKYVELIDFLSVRYGIDMVEALNNLDVDENGDTPFVFPSVQEVKSEIKIGGDENYFSKCQKKLKKYLFDTYNLARAELGLPLIKEEEDSK